MKNSFILSLLLLFAFSSSTLALEKESFPLLQGPLIDVGADKLTVRLIPHSHDDIGWLKTIDEYYIDSEKQITMQGVQYILDSVIPLLNLDPKKRFMYVEMGFFQRWWEEQEKDVQDMVRKLVKNGQFEFVNGGYCMNDEATAYYEDVIDQMTFGHQFLLSTFGVIPQIGWHIDPFGHANAQPALFAQMGFNAFFFSRIDYQDKSVRVKNKGSEMLWIPETSQGIENAMFTHVNYYSYSNPSGCNFDILGDDNPVQDNPAYGGYNVVQISNSFISWFKGMQAGYLTTDLFHTAGDDFQYMAANMPFKSYDRLFKYMKKYATSSVDVMFNTPIEYIRAINPQNKKYPTKTDDFFPYADEESAYWTGYFTSRVAFKGLVRQCGQFLQAAKRLATQTLWEKTSSYVSNNFAKVDAALVKLEDAMAASQHHDAVTGTAKQKVNEDYKMHLARGLNAVKDDFVYPYFKEKIASDLKISGAQLSTCNLNTSTIFCPVTYQNLGKGTPVLLAIYNSGPARDSIVRVKVPNGDVQVKDQNGIEYPTDVICSNRTDTTDCDLFFSDSFGGFDVSYYYLVKSSSSNLVKADPLSVKFDYPINTNQTITATNYTYYTINYCTSSSKSSCYQTSFNLAYNYYESYQEKGQPSGAYIFRPSTKTKNGALPYARPEAATIYRGKNLIQVHLHSERIITDMRIYGDLASGIEVSSFVNWIPVEEDVQGKEVVLEVVTPSIKSADVFYTDSMGMEMQKRVFNYRPTWTLKVTEPVAGNYYPIQSTILIQDKSGSEALAIIPDRAQGGSSIRQGQIELMIHRRLVQDDFRGVDEMLNEYDWDGNGMRQWVTHTLLFTKPGFIETSFREVQYKNDVALLTMLAPSPKTPFVEKKNETANELKFGDFDSNIKLLSRPLSTNKFVLRFQNMHETKNMTVPTIVFSNSKFKKGSVVEMSLTYNQPKTDMIKSRLNWNGLNLNNPSFAKTDYLTSDKFLLRPQEIRTFVVSFESSTPPEAELITV